MAAADARRQARQLCNAAERGDTAAAEALLASGADPRATIHDDGRSLYDMSSRGCTALHVAASRGHADVARLLLARGADVNAADESGDTALHSASAGGHVEVARLLLDCGADVDAATKDGSTALHYAAEDGLADVARLLLDRGADVDATTRAPSSNNDWGYGSCQPLHLAAYNKHSAVVELLLARGADAHAVAVWCGVAGMTPLHLAAVDANQSSLQAVWRTLGALLAAGAAVDAAAGDGRRALHFAVGCGGDDAAEVLLAHHADVNARAANGATPLHVACGLALRGGGARAVRCARLLLEDASADANAPLDESGRTPLHVAAHYANDGDGVTVVADLLERGADARAADLDGRTPLHAACDPPGRLVPGLVRALLKHGADARAADLDGRQPLHCLAARAREQDDDWECGIAADVEVVDEESDDLKDVEAVIKALQRRGADVDALDGEGRTPIMLAARSRNGAASAALVRRGARVGPPACSLCDPDGEARTGMRFAVVGFAAEAARLRRQRAAWKKERAAIKAARGSGSGGGGGSGGGAEQQQKEQPAAKSQRGRAGVAAAAVMTGGGGGCDCC